MSTEDTKACAEAVTDAMGRAFIAKHKDFWPGAGRPSLPDAKELIAAALAAAPTPPPAEGIVSDDAGDASCLRGFIREFGMTPSMMASARDIEKRRADKAEAELASIKALPPLHERIVPAQGDEVARLREALEVAREYLAFDIRAETNTSHRKSVIQADLDLIDAALAVHTTGEHGAMAETADVAPCAWGFLDGAYLWLDVNAERLVSTHDARGRVFPLYAPGTDPAIATLIAERDRALAALDAMRAERDAAAEALEPFAEQADNYEPEEGDGGQIAWASDFTIGQLRYARNTRAALHALATQEKPQGIPAGKEDKP